MAKLVTASQFADPDAAYRALVEARRSLSEARRGRTRHQARAHPRQPYRRSRRAARSHRAGERWLSISRTDAAWQRAPLIRDVRNAEFAKVPVQHAHFMPRCARDTLYGMARNCASARALDGDEVVATAAVAGAGAAGRNRAGNVVAIDLAVGQSLREFVCAAIRIGGRLTAGRAGREAAIDAVAVAVVGDDENALLRMCGAGAEQKSSAKSSRDAWNAWIPQCRSEASQQQRCNKPKCGGQVKITLTYRTQCDSADSVIDLPQSGQSDSAPPDMELPFHRIPSS